jgi:hypothetical protein
MPTPAPLVNPALEHATALPMPEVSVTEYLRHITDVTSSLVDNFEEQLNEVNLNSEDISDWIDPMLGIDPIAEFESGLLDLFPPDDISAIDDCACLDFLDGEVCPTPPTFKFCILQPSVDGYVKKPQALHVDLHPSLHSTPQLAFPLLHSLVTLCLLINAADWEPEWDPGGTVCTPTLGASNPCTTTAHGHVPVTTAQTFCGIVSKPFHIASNHSSSPLMIYGELGCDNYIVISVMHWTAKQLQSLLHLDAPWESPAQCIFPDPSLRFHCISPQPPLPINHGTGS